MRPQPWQSPAWSSPDQFADDWTMDFLGPLEDDVDVVCTAGPGDSLGAGFRDGDGYGDPSLVETDAGEGGGELFDPGTGVIGRDDCGGWPLPDPEYRADDYTGQELP